MRSPILLVLAALLLVPAYAFAADFDVRIKGGKVPGVDTMYIESIVDATDGNADSSNNAQAELVVAFMRGRFSPLFTIGGFNRSHSGTVTDLWAGMYPTLVNYDASGLTVGGGVRYKISPYFNMEAKIELGFGSGKNVSFVTPGDVPWNQIKAEEYVSSSLIIGGYFVGGKPGPIVGVEVGFQEWTGDFQIWNNRGFWSDGYVSGSGGMVNLVVGVRF